MFSRSTIAIRSSAVVAAVIAASFGLTGCGIGFTPASDDARDDASASRPQSQEATPAPADDSSIGDDDADAAGDDDAADDPSDDDDVTRDALEAAVEKTVGCPGGVLDISDSGSVIDIDSDCAEVTLSGSGTSVLADDIDSLIVTGTGITVFVDRLGALEVTGIGNLVEWDSGSPAPSDTGTGNTLRPAN